jgi:hypothetical protein
MRSISPQQSQPRISVAFGLQRGRPRLKLPREHLSALRSKLIGAGAWPHKRLQPLSSVERYTLSKSSALAKMADTNYTITNFTTTLVVTSGQPPTTYTDVFTTVLFEFPGKSISSTVTNITIGGVVFTNVTVPVVVYPAAASTSITTTESTAPLFKNPTSTTSSQITQSISSTRPPSATKTVTVTVAADSTGAIVGAAVG